MPKKSAAATADETVDFAEFIQEQEAQRLDAEASERQQAQATYQRLILQDRLTKFDGQSLMDAAETLGIPAQQIVDDQRMVARVRELSKVRDEFDSRQEEKHIAREAWQTFLERSEIEAIKLDALLTYAERRVELAGSAATEILRFSERRPELFDRTGGKPTLIQPN